MCGSGTIPPTSLDSGSSLVKLGTGMTRKANKGVMMKKTMFGMMLGAAVFGTVAQAKVDPLSKIEIKSNRAFTTPLKQEPGLYLVRYEQDVRIDLADKTHMTAESLEVIVARKASKKSKKDESVSVVGQKITTNDQQLKSVVLKGNVKINRLNHSVRSDRAELLMDKKQCTVQGNVHIVQKKNAASDIPVVINSEKAVLDLTTEKLLLVGSEKSPVCTTFELARPVKEKKPLVA